MTKRATYLASLAVLALGAVSAPSAQANFVAVFEQVGPNVEEIGDGTIDLTDLGPAGPLFSLTSGISPEFGIMNAGAKGRNVTFFPNVAISGPSNFGPGTFSTLANIGAGDGVAGAATGIGVPLNYVSGASLFNLSVYLNATFGSLGIAPGSYVWTWGSGADANSFTIDIAVPTQGEDINQILLAALPLPPEELFPLAVPEPSTWAMMLLGLAGLGYAAVRRRGARRPVLA